MSQSSPFYRTKTFSLSVGLAISAGCLWLAVRGMPLGEILAAFQQAHYWTLPVILLDLALFYWLKAYRWRLLLLPTGQFRSTQDLLPPIMMGFAFNNVLPARLGEVIRCFAFSKQQKVPLSITFSSVVLERILDGIAIVTYLGVGLMLVEGLDPTIQLTAYTVAGISVALVLGGVVYVIWTKPFVAVVEWILARISLIPTAIRAKICQLLEEGALGLAALKDVKLVLAMLAISYVKWFLNAALVLLSLWTFELTATPAVCAVVMGVIAFGVAVPSAPGYFGLIQLCFTAVLKLFIEDQEAIFAASIYYHLSQYIPVTLFGLGCFVRSGLSLTQAEHVKEDLDEQTKLSAPAVDSSCIERVAS